MTRSENVLSRFHPLIEGWFAEQVGRPTEVQEKGWSRITKGEHVLITAPTGSGKTLTFHVPPDDPNLQQIVAPLRHLLTRRFKPLRRITIERINGEEAPRSPYLDALRISFEALLDYKKVSLYSSARR